MTHFADRLFQAVKSKGTVLCVGLDPHMDLIPEHLFAPYRHMESQGQANALVVHDFIMRILDAVTPMVAVVKPQFAFFERLGAPGMEALRKICGSARERGLIVIADAKRGDIGSTAAAYAQAYLPGAADVPECVPVPIPVDAITINPYLGFDSIQPFLDRSVETGIFVLVKTSNASGVQIQDLVTREGNTISETIAGYVSEWGHGRIGTCGYSDVGAVVGATYPGQARALREIMPHTPFLIPGYGFQGGGAKDAVLTFDSNGLGGVVNSSRQILFAVRSQPYCQQFSETQFDEAARIACLHAVNDLNRAMPGGL